MASVTDSDEPSLDGASQIASDSIVPDEIQEKAKKILVLERQVDELKAEVKAWYKEHRTPIVVGDGAFLEVSSKQFEVTDLAALVETITGSGYSPEDFMTLNKTSYDRWTKHALKDGDEAVVKSASAFVTVGDGPKTFKFVKGGEDSASA